MVAESYTVDLSYIREDVRNQLALSRDILAQVQALQATLPRIENPEARAAVENAIRHLMTSVSDLANNANTTSVHTVATVVSSARSQ